MTLHSRWERVRGWQAAAPTMTPPPAKRAKETND